MISGPATTLLRSERPSLSGNNSNDDATLFKTRVCSINRLLRQGRHIDRHNQHFLQLEKGGADLILYDSQVTSFVVAELLDAVVGGVREAHVDDGAAIEHFNTLLVEVEDDPFCFQKVLP